MQMRAGGTARRADAANDLADADRLSDLDVDRREMRVARRKAVAVIDLDHVAVAAVASRDRDGAGRGGARGFADVGAKVEPGMHRGAAQERIGAHAEP